MDSLLVFCLSSDYQYPVIVIEIIEIMELVDTLRILIQNDDFIPVTYN